MDSQHLADTFKDFADGGGWFSLLSSGHQTQIGNGLTVGTAVADKYLKSKVAGSGVGTTAGAVISIVNNFSITIAWIDYGIEQAWATDPPSSDFTAIATPPSFSAPFANPKAIGSTTATALNALGQNEVAEFANLSAMTTSFERAKGAVIAKSSRWESAQCAAASKYALRAAQLLAKRPRLQAELVSAFKTFTPPVSLSLAKGTLESLQASLSQSSAPLAFLNDFASLGAPTKQATAVWHEISTTKTINGENFPDYLDSAALVVGEKAEVGSLSSFAAWLDHIVTKTKNAGQ